MAGVAIGAYVGKTAHQAAAHDPVGDRVVGHLRFGAAGRASSAWRPSSRASPWTACSAASAPGNPPSASAQTSRALDGAPSEALTAPRGGRRRTLLTLARRG